MQTNNDEALFNDLTDGRVNFSSNPSVYNAERRMPFNCSRCAFVMSMMDGGGGGVDDENLSLMKLHSKAQSLLSCAQMEKIDLESSGRLRNEFCSHNN
ncbi:hypothetical protein T07_12909 [Trichinella nelsoni]|uniref:Uncharacterized protein n=1 Tax=Trichinella nelsoni TaxID=6336 RepID=A0A0V0RQF0_9BILA|nr:hypothetical protein T07_12909 [Trichinella nelsoni]